MTDWQEFKNEFEAIPTFYDILSAERRPNPDDAGEWFLTGNLPIKYRENFREIASKAGKKITGLKDLDQKILQETNDFSRWLTAISLMTGAYVRRELFWETDNGDRKILYSGKIENAIPASVALCDVLSKEKRPIGSKPKRRRLELDEGRGRFRIDDTWHTYAGDHAGYFLGILLKAKGKWEPGCNLVSATATRPDRVFKSLKEPIRAIIESKRGGTGGYRIKLEYFDLT